MQFDKINQYSGMQPKHIPAEFNEFNSNPPNFDTLLEGSNNQSIPPINYQ